MDTPTRTADAPYATTTEQNDQSTNPPISI